jgi:ribonuclease HII
MLKARHTEDSEIEAGIDEAGRGCLWGPLMAAAVIWPYPFSEEVAAISLKIKDSKKLSPKMRSILEQQIKLHAVAWSVGRVEAEEIDKLGMTRSNRLAFERAIDGLSIEPTRLLIDGILPVMRNIEQIVEPKGDETYLAIAAASILAKEEHDRAVKSLCESDTNLDTRYGLLNSKGYGTAKHREGIIAHGMHPLHRRLFLRKLLGITLTSDYEFID